MDELYLCIPTENDIPAIDNYREEIINTDGNFEGCGSLGRLSATDWLDHFILLSSRETCPPDKVVSTQFLCFRKQDNKIVGMIQVRHYYNDYLAKYAGLIGYSVRPSERRKGYATWMLKQALPYCKKIGLDKVLICCEVCNEASRRTILSYGGVFEKEDYSPDEDIYLERYWIET